MSVVIQELEVVPDSPQSDTQPRSQGGTRAPSKDEIARETAKALLTEHYRKLRLWAH